MTTGPVSKQIPLIPSSASIFTSGADWPFGHTSQTRQGLTSQPRISLPLNGPGNGQKLGGEFPVRIRFANHWNAGRSEDQRTAFCADPLPHSGRSDADCPFNLRWAHSCPPGIPFTVASRSAPTCRFLASPADPRKTESRAPNEGGPIHVYGGRFRFNQCLSSKAGQSVHTGLSR